MLSRSIIQRDSMTHRQIRYIASSMLMLVTSVFTLNISIAQPDSARYNALLRRYQIGDTLSYYMKATSQDLRKTVQYEVRADGVVKMDSAGRFFEEYSWSNLNLNGTQVALPPASASFRQLLSLAPHFTPSMPDLRQVHPNLIGPILDMGTFYVDLWLATQQIGLVNKGDYVSIKHGKPNTWADGMFVLVGEDAIDFDITLEDIDHANQIAVVVVRHVPPANPQIKLPADWMLSPVADTPNNWVQVVKGRDGTYVAQVGKETFNVRLNVSLGNGAIVSAQMDNLVEVLQRQCSEPALTQCGDSIRYQVKRSIQIQRK
jgi:hypothetical protein